MTGSLMGSETARLTIRLSKYVASALVGCTKRRTSSAGSLPVIDLRGCTILPGLIDAHVHLNLPGDGTTFEEAMRERDEVLVANAAFSSAVSLRAGITTLRDTGSRGMTTFGLRRAFELGIAPGPRLLLCGQSITITGGHTWYFGGEADGPDALRQKVRLLIKHGADFIKVISGGGGTPNTTPWLPSFDSDEMRSIVDTAHRLGRRVTAHCLCAEATRVADQRRRRPIGARRLHGQRRRATIRTGRRRQDRGTGRFQSRALSQSGGTASRK